SYPRRRALRLTVLGGVLVILAALLIYKPYLPSAIYHNYANIDDYKIFAGRLVKARPPGSPWKIAESQNAGPPESTQRLLSKLRTTALLMVDNNQIVYEKYFLSGG